MHEPASNRQESVPAPRHEGMAGSFSRVSPAAAADVPLTWTSWREALRVVGHRPHLKRTTAIAVSVGCILFGINQLDVVLRGQATAAVWAKGALTFLVPFCVSNIGVLVGTRRKSGNVETNVLEGS